MLTDAMADELRLVALVESTVELDRLTARAAGPELLAEAGGVVRDQAVGGIEDGAGGAVVLLETEELRARVVAAEILHVLRTGSPEPVHRLIVVADHERRAGLGARHRRRRDQLQPRILNRVRVLELVHQHVAKASAVMREELRIVTPQLERPQQQLGEIQYPAAGTGFLIGGVQPDELPAGRIAAV